MTHKAIPIRRYDRMGRTHMKCTECTRDVHQRYRRGVPPVWVHTRSAKRGAA